MDPTGLTANIGLSGRAGRATAMADAVGMDPGFLVNYPVTSTLSNVFLGGLAGAGLGAGAGALAGNNAAVPGSIIGAGAGTLGGLLIGNILRRKKMKEIADAYEAAPSVDPKLHDPSILDLFGGFHNRARQRAIGAMLGSGENPSELLPDEVATTAIGNLLNPVVPGLAFVPPIVSNVAARSKAVENKERKNNPKRDSSQEKKSAIIKVASNLNKMCVKQALLEVPYVEEQLLEQLSPGSVPASRKRKRRNAAIGGVAGGLVGGLTGAGLGAPLAGVGALPGGLIGGLGGLYAGSYLTPAALEYLAKPRTSEGAALSKDPELQQLLKDISRAKRNKRLASLGIGAGVGALAGLPFAGVGSLPGAGIGLVGGALYDALTDSQKAKSLIESEKGQMYKQKLMDALQKQV
jgi:hypothetical protein